MEEGIPAVEEEHADELAELLQGLPAESNGGPDFAPPRTQAKDTGRKRG